MNFLLQEFLPNVTLIAYSPNFHPAVLKVKVFTEGFCDTIFSPLVSNHIVFYYFIIASFS